eukprot:g10100.t1
MLETELLMKEAVGVEEQTVLRIPYWSIRVLTWDHATSGLKVDHEASSATSTALNITNQEKETAAGQSDSSKHELVFISVRVDNSIDLEDELKQRARAEALRARKAGRAPEAGPTSIYLGMFAGFTKPKPFQRKRPNLSFTVPEGKLPALKEMRSWSYEEHEGISRPQICSLRPKLAMDAVFLGENRFCLSAVEGLTFSSPEVPDARYRSRCGELVLKFAYLEVQLRDECGRNAVFLYDDIADWSLSVVPGTGPRPPSGLELWLLPQRAEQVEAGGELDLRRPSLSSRSSSSTSSSGTSSSTGTGTTLNSDDDGLDFKARARREIEHEAKLNSSRMGEDSSVRRRDSGSKGGDRGKRHVFLGIPDEDLVLARNSMEYFWNARRAELHLPPKAGSTHGRCVASMVTLRGEVKAPALPTGRTDPVDLSGVDVCVGQVVHKSPRRGQLKLLPSPRALLGVEKKRTLRHNADARSQWERVVLHQGWLRKRGGGAIKRWIWRYFVLYDTPQGHFLAYYDDVSEVPLFNEARKERKVVDLCKVCFLRPEIGRQRPPGLELPANAFTIVTTERQWTLAADSRDAVLEWLRMLSVAVDEDVAVVHDGEILFEVKAHWAQDGVEYGPENAGTVHLGSMGMELRYGYSEAVSSSLAALAGHPRKRSAASANYANNMRFWSFTDFYKWTIVLLQDGLPALAVQCFTDDLFKNKENLLLVTPQAKRLALAIEHQVEKFMAVMHLRLERPDTMAMTATPVQPATGKISSMETSIVVASPSGRNDEVDEVGDASSSSVAADASEARKLSTHSTTADELHRVPSMNLATDPTLWVADATLGPGAPGGKSSDGGGGGGGINPFDSSSEEDEDDGGVQTRVVAWAGDTEDGGGFDASLEATGGRPLAKGRNPFDFLFLDGKETTTVADAATPPGRDEHGIESTPPVHEPTPFQAAVLPATATALSTSQSSRIGEIFPVEQVAPGTATTASAAGVAAAGTQEIVWPEAVDSSSIPRYGDQLLLTSGAPTWVQAVDLPPADSPSTAMTSPASPMDSPGVPLTSFSSAPSVTLPPPPASTAEEVGVSKAPQNKRLPPTPLLASGAGGASSSSPYPSPPVTPFAAPLAKAPAGVRDRAGVPPSPDAIQEQEDLFAAFRDTPTEAAPPALGNEQAELFAAFRDGTETPAAPLPSKEEMDLHLAFRDNPKASAPRASLPALPQPQLSLLQPAQLEQSASLEPRGLLDEADSSRRLQNFNPFGRPGSFVLSQTPSQIPSEEPARASGQVLHDNGSSLRVVLDSCVKTGGTCLLSLRYQLRVPPQTTLCVELVESDAAAASKSTSTSALEISFRPSMSCVDLDQEGEDCGGSRRELRQALSITCNHAFSSPPEVALTTSDRPLATARVPLQAVSVAAFMTGLSIGPDDFRRTWTILSCSEQTVVSGDEVRQQQQQGEGEWPRAIETADVRRLLVDTLGMREVVQQRSPGGVAEVGLLAAAGQLQLTSPVETAGAAKAGEKEDPPAVPIVCLVGVELHGATGAARVTTKSTEPVLAESVQKEVLEGIRRLEKDACDDHSADVYAAEVEK